MENILLLNYVQYVVTFEFNIKVEILPGAGLVEDRPAVPVDLRGHARDLAAVVAHVGPGEQRDFVSSAKLISSSILT